MRRSILFRAFIGFFSFSLLHSIESRCQNQDNGIKFETGATLLNAMEKAKLEKKLLFVDCYTTWCYPCKYMEKNIYPIKEVGDFFNDKCVSIKMQMDKTEKDSANVRSWYAVADSLAKKYHIDAYPTYLILTADGTPVSKWVGGSDYPSEFIAKADCLQDTSKQYFTVLANREGHLNDSAFLINAALTAINAGDDDNARIFANNFIDNLKNPITRKNLDFVAPFIFSESDKGFGVFLHNAAYIDRVSEKHDFAEQVAAGAIFNDRIAPLLNDKKTPIDIETIMQELVVKYPAFDKEKFTTKLDESFRIALGKELIKKIRSMSIKSNNWSDFSSDFKRRFPRYDCGQIVLNAKARYYFGVEDWKECCEAAIDLIEHYKSKIANESINNITWMTIFQHCNDSNILNRTLVVMRKVVEESSDDFYSLDTYANLLYKTGHIKEAIEYENRAIHFSLGSDRSGELKDNLAKMKKGQPTWVTANSGS